MKADAKTKAEVMAVLNKFLEANEKKNWDNLQALFAPDPDVVMIGVHEKSVGMAEIKAFVKRSWSQTKTGSIEYGWTSVSTAGAVAWVAADSTVHTKVGGQEMSSPTRITAVLEKRGDKWLIVQFHHSVPAAGQPEGKA